MEEQVRCIFCDANAVPTNEHVVPEFAGGALIIRNVCKTCNDKMGSDFEGPISRSLLFRLPRYSYGIRGKSQSPIAPFPSTGITDHGYKVILDDEMKPRLKTGIEERDNEDGGVELRLNIDASERHKIPKIMEEKIRRIARKKWPEMTKDKVDALVEQGLATLPDELEIKSEQLPIKYSESIDLNALRLLFMKVAFEIAVHHHGSEVISDPQTLSLRSAINRRDTKAKIAVQLLPNPDPFSVVQFPEKSHAVLLYGNACYVRLFTMSAIVKVVNDDSAYVLPKEKWMAYWFDYIKEIWSKESFLQHIAAQAV